ncbi:MAG: class II fructose-bisphosphate aldolase [Mahellales bacterium]
MPLVNLKDMMEKANKEKYAVGMFCTFNLAMAQGVLEAAQQLNSPVILAYAEVFMPTVDAAVYTNALRTLAQNASVPVAVHLDHGIKYNNILKAMFLGFTSVMFDGSQLSLKDNIKRTKEIVDIAAANNISVEAELGHVGGLTGEYGSGSLDKQQEAYTQVDEAVEFVDRTGVDVLAVAVGTVHGVYQAEPKLDFDRLRNIKEAVGIPLALHGGSGLSGEDLKRLIQLGINKVNIFTDITTAAIDAIKSVTNAGTREKPYSYMDIEQASIKAIKETALEKIPLLGSSNKG